LNNNGSFKRSRNEILAKKLEKESRLVREESLKILSEFEKIDELKQPYKETKSTKKKI